MPVRRKRPTRKQVAIRATISCVIAFALLSAAAGALLAARLDVGAYRFTSVLPYAKGTRPRGTASYYADFIHADAGGIYLGGRHASPPPPGVLLGSAQFSATTSYSGFPRSYTSDWTLTLSSVKPAADGPPASDTKAWSAIVAAGLARTRSGGGAIPRSMLKGQSAGTTFSIRDFSFNAGWRLLHDPVWPAGCLLIALLFAAASVWPSLRILRRGPFACIQCGYDRRGLDAVAPCPECGTAPVPAA